MILIRNDFTSPAMSLAAEEFVLENFVSGDYMMLWQSPPSVITGKFQNIYEEVAVGECLRRGVGVYRRNSGGGTVYHDGGNVNFTFYADRCDVCSEYTRFLFPVIRALCAMGIPAEEGMAYDIVIDGKKVSGNAQSVHKNRVMHHGTLLFDVDLGALSSLTGHARESIKSKSIKSRPSPVANMKTYLPGTSSAEFRRLLTDELKDIFCCNTEYAFTANEMEAIASLAERKYSSWEWNYGRSPYFELSDGEFTLESKGGEVLSSSLYPERLIGVRLMPKNIRDALTGYASDDEIDRINAALFG